MKKNEMGKILKVFGVIVIVLGIISSLILGFSTMHGNPMNEIMGYMMEPTIGYNFSKAIFGIFASVIAGLMLMGIAEIINILEEKRENIRRLCLRFGINPVESNPYTVRSGARNGGNANMAPNMNQNMAPNMNPNMAPNMNPNVAPNMDGQTDAHSSNQKEEQAHMDGENLE